MHKCLLSSRPRRQNHPEYQFGIFTSFSHSLFPSCYSVALILVDMFHDKWVCVYFWFYLNPDYISDPLICWLSAVSSLWASHNMPLIHLSIYLSIWMNEWMRQLECHLDLLHNRNAHTLMHKCVTVPEWHLTVIVIFTYHFLIIIFLLLLYQYRVIIYKYNVTWQQTCKNNICLLYLFM